MEVDEHFSYFTDEQGNKYQVLRYRFDEELQEDIPFDWDEQASAALMNKAAE